MPKGNPGKTHTKEHIENNRLAHLGQPAWNKGLKGINSGAKNHFFGKHHTDKVKDVIRQSARLRIGEKNPNYKPKVKKECPICYKIFEVKPSHEFQKCCSLKCMGQWRSQNLKGDNSPASKPKIIVICAECGKEIKRNPYRAKENLKYGHFCSIGCLSLWKSKHICKENHWNWQGGIDSYPYCIKWTDEFRERVRIYYGYVCVECGTPQFALKGKFKQLSIHHVNYDKDTCCNDKEPLFVCLCNSCNTRANGNKEKSRVWWEQHFTDMINNYYSGKCYLTKEEMVAYTSN